MHSFEAAAFEFIANDGYVCWIVGCVFVEATDGEEEIFVRVAGEFFGGGAGEECGVWSDEGFGVCEGLCVCQKQGAPLVCCLRTKRQIHEKTRQVV